MRTGGGGSLKNRLLSAWNFRGTEWDYVIVGHVDLRLSFSLGTCSVTIKKGL